MVRGPVCYIQFLGKSVTWGLNAVCEQTQEGLNRVQGSLKLENLKCRKLTAVSVQDEAVHLN